MGELNTKSLNSMEMPGGVMETITVLIGRVESLSNGMVQDARREVRFEGKMLGKLETYGYDDKRGRLTDSRGTTEILYRAADGRLVVHVEDWSLWQGEPTTERLAQVNESDLQPNGEYEALGRACGFGRPLTLDEALTPAA